MHSFLSAWNRHRAARLPLIVVACLGFPLRVAAAECAGPTPLAPQGSHYKANAPLRTILLEKGATGAKLWLSGRVLDHNCRAVLGALLDVWHADDAGRFDEVGFKLRGRQTTDTQGRYRLETVLPGPAPGNARTLFLKIAAPGGRVVTTRLYFPDDPANESDSFFQSSLVMKLERNQDGATATFDFVLPRP